MKAFQLESTNLELIIDSISLQITLYDFILIFYMLYIQCIFVGCQTHALDINRPTVNTWLTPALSIPICSFINWALGQKPGIPGVKRGTRRAPPLVTFAMHGMRAMRTICAFCQDFDEEYLISSCHQQGARVPMFLCGLLRGLFDEGFGLERTLICSRTWTW